MPYIIETTNLAKEFAENKGIAPVVNNVNLRVENGELLALVGPNGAGKTTLIKMLCCLVLPTRGEAKVAGYDILVDEEKVRASIGLSSGDERSFYWRLTGRQNLQFFASLYNLTWAQAELRIEELMGFLEINEPDKRFQEYSTGLKQRLGIARCLLNDPKVLFMDEPTKSLDPPAAEKLRKFIREELVRKQNKTILFVTQNLDEAEYLADRLAIMNKGEIKALGTADGLRQMIKSPHATIQEVFSRFIKE